jgi:hypothetical protein
MPTDSKPPVMRPMTEKHVEVLNYWLKGAGLGSDTASIRDIESLVRSIVNGELVVVPRKELERWMTDPYQSVAARKEQLMRWLTPDTSKESKP